MGLTMTFSYVDISDPLAPPHSSNCFSAFESAPPSFHLQAWRACGYPGIFSVSLNLLNSDSGSTSSAPLTVPVPYCDLNGQCPPTWLCRVLSAALRSHWLCRCLMAALLLAPCTHLLVPLGRLQPTPGCGPPPGWLLRFARVLL